MSKLTDRVSYLLGLAEGMKLSPEKDSHRLILEMLSVLSDAAEELEALTEAHEELGEYVESIDDCLSDVEDVVFADEDDEDELPDDDEPGVVVEYACPHCGAELSLRADEIDFDEAMLCPECGKELFPEEPEDEEADGAEDEKADGVGDEKAAEKPEAQDGDADKA